MSTSTPPSSSWEESVAMVAERLLSRLSDLTREVSDVIGHDVPEVGSPSSGLRRLLEQMARSNIDNSLTAMANLMPLHQLQVTTASLELARRLGERGEPAYLTVRVYQVGHRWLMRQVLQEFQSIQVQCIDPNQLSQLVDWHLGYLNAMSAAAGAEHSRVQELWTRTPGAATAAQVEYVLNETDDPAEATAVLGYDVAATHVGLVLWSENLTMTAGKMAGLVRSVLSQPGVLSLIVVPHDLMSVHAWISVADSPTHALAQLAREIREQGDLVRVAAGEPSPGLPGFRLTHRQAGAARRVAELPGSRGSRLTRYHDVAAASLLSLHQEEALPWARDVLGPLAGPGEELRRLRLTLQAYLDEGENASNAAQRMYVHRNTVKYRVERAISMLPIPIEKNRLSVSLALAYHARVVSP